MAFSMRLEFGIGVPEPDALARGVEFSRVALQPPDARRVAVLDAHSPAHTCGIVVLKPHHLDRHC